MSVFELAKRYYPRLWDAGRIRALVEAGRLTQWEAQEIMEGVDSLKATNTNNSQRGGGRWY